jgi:hypothetical protein
MLLGGSRIAAGSTTVVCGDAHAATPVVNWTAGSGSWSKPGNWSSMNVPTPQTDVEIVHNDAANRVITFDYNYTDPLARVVIDQTGTGTTTFVMSSSSGTIGTRYQTLDDQMIVGNLGRATVLQSGGTNTGLGSYSFYYQVHLGENPGSAGTYNLSGGTLQCAGLLVGNAGAGTFIQTAGLASVDFGYICTGPGGSGRFDLSGSATFVGRNMYTQDGTALINMTGGSWLGTSMYIALGGTATFNLSAGTCTIGQLAIAGTGTGLFNQTGGVTTINQLSIGLGTVTSGNYNITGGSLTLKDTSSVGVNSTGSLTIGSSGFVSANYIAVGSQNFGIGTITMNGGTLSSFEESVGYDGVGSFVHNGGSHTVQRLFIADDTTGAGIYILNGGTLSVGDEFVGSQGLGFFNQTGGQHTVGTALTIADQFQNGCAYNLSGGTLSALQLINQGGTYTQTGGVATFSFGISSSVGTTSVSGTGQLFVARIEQAALNIGTGGFVKCFSNGAPPVSNSYLHYFDIAGTSGNWAGKWDLNNNALVFDCSFLPNFPDGRIRDYIATAYAGGNWTGNGLTSSAAAVQANSAHKTALGFADAAVLFSCFPAVWNGAVIEDPTILVRYTYVGDLNLDGVVNSVDFAMLASHFNSNNAFWTDGDCNYDGRVNSLDFNALSANFGLSISPSSALGTIVPEPSLLAVVVGLALRHRSRR